MKTQEVKIEVPIGFEIDKQNSTFEKIVFKEVKNNMQKVYEFHNTTEEEFDKLYENLPKHVKAFEKECMIVAYYNKGWKPDFSNSKEYKYYPWFCMDDFRLSLVDYYYANSSCSARAMFKSESDCRNAVKEFFDVFKESRLNL